ncbi:heparinase II/III family protein [Tsuneonella sp. YG55]|uniref:Heparinase II/III family protein n=1 Tax=Tsuneonella litorea TaxID=2976475 RepID=A0A9X3ANL9_9SPHN|nr:heparinase II/III family protein [Tsuneonella litorea]MCT2559922.1 heparinase II/III family protein [Tsuneonella litorea]
MSDAALEQVRERAPDAGAAKRALPLGPGVDPHALYTAPGEVIEPGRALAIADFAPPSVGAGEALIRLAYRMGVSGSTLARPFGKPAKPRLLGTVNSPLPGERAPGVALRAGHFFVHGVKAPIAQMDFAPAAPLTPPFARTVHGFTWLRDLAACAPREQCTATAERILAAWLAANPKPGKGAPWHVENAGRRLLNWLVHAPLILSGDGKLRARALAAMEATARWLDRNVTKAPDGLGEVTGWAAIVAAGLLLPDGKPRRLYGEAGLIKALGELVAEDGGTLSRSPLAQIETIALLTELKACYRAVRRDPPPAIEAMLNLLVPPLLALTHGDGGLGSWQGAGAVSAERISALVAASGVRTRPLKEARQWGYQRATGGKAVLQFDAAPPPLAKHARSGCASTLAFEFSHGPQRIVVNCGGAAFAGGQVPVRIEQGLRATAAHSTLVLDDANSTAVLLHGKLGAGVTEVEIDRRVMPLGNGNATRLEASHDGYAGRHGLTHRRILILRDDGSELRGEDLLIPAGKTAKRGKIGFALRFHIGPGIELGLSDDRRGAGLALPDGSYWQFRLGQTGEGVELSIEESLWIDGQGRPQPIQQIVIQGLTPRSGGSFAWVFKKMG